METFKKDIKEWVSIDNKMKVLNEEIRALRQSKSDVSDKINHYVEDNQLDASTISISDGRLKFVETKQIQPISMKFIEKCLSECIEDSSSVEQIMSYIKDSREYKTNKDIKRYYNKEKKND